MDTKVVPVVKPTSTIEGGAPRESSTITHGFEAASASAVAEFRHNLSLVTTAPDAQRTSTYREVQLENGLVRRDLAGVGLGKTRFQRGDVTEASITYHGTKLQSEVVLRMERVRDPLGSISMQCERLQVRIKPCGSLARRHDPQRQSEVVELISECIRTQLVQIGRRKSKEVDYGKLVSDIRRLEHGLLAISEITAENIALEFDASGSQPIVLDGLVLKDCGNLTIVGNRTNEEKIDGVFSVLAPYMLVDGGFGGITVKGVDLSKLRLIGIHDSQMSMLRFVECQLRGAHVDGECSVQILSAWDCSFGEGVDLAALSVKSAPRSIEEFKVVFGGTIWAKNGAFALPANFEFECFKPLLEETHPSNTASTMLNKRCEVSLANLIQSSTALSPVVVDVREETKILEISFAEEGKVLVHCGRYPPLSGWRVAEVAVVPEGDETQTTSVWTRKRNVKPEDVEALESIIDKLFERKLRQRTTLEG